MTRRVLFAKEDDGSFLLRDVIEYEGKLWLVPEWSAGPTAATEMPARIICLDGMPLRKPSPQYQDRVDWVLSTPLSTDILEGRRASQNPLVIERPRIHLRVKADCDGKNLLRRAQA
jgi:hypothetical protein